MRGLLEQRSVKLARIARTLLFVFGTVFAWTWATPAFAAAGLCDESGASSIAPAPLLIVSLATIDAADDDAPPSESLGLPVVHEAPQRVAVDDSRPMPALPAEIVLTTFKLSLDRVDAPPSASCSARGVRHALDRPPRP